MSRARRFAGPPAMLIFVVLAATIGLACGGGENKESKNTPAPAVT